MRRRPNARCFQDRLQFAGAYHGIHFRDIPANLVAVALHQASGDDQLGCPPPGFVARHLQNRVNRLLLGGINKTARVDNQDLRLFRTRSQARTGAIQQPHHHF